MVRGVWKGSYGWMRQSGGSGGNDHHGERSVDLPESAMICSPGQVYYLDLPPHLSSKTTRPWSHWLTGCRYSLRFEQRLSTARQPLGAVIFRGIFSTQKWNIAATISSGVSWSPLKHNSKTWVYLKRYGPNCNSHCPLPTTVQPEKPKGCDRITFIPC